MLTVYGLAADRSLKGCVVHEAAELDAAALWVDLLNSGDELRDIDAYWRAANYLAVGQIYLLDNPLLREPLRLEHIKPRLLGHWGTTPGLNLIYVHLNRVIKARDLNVLFVTGPGHGAPGIVTNTYLEGSYTELYPGITRDRDGIKKM